MHRITDKIMQKRTKNIQKKKSPKSETFHKSPLLKEEKKQITNNMHNSSMGKVLFPIIVRHNTIIYKRSDS